MAFNFDTIKDKYSKAIDSKCLKNNQHHGINLCSNVIKLEIKNKLAI
ncbi:607_t:CDS:1, partial [Gigaspora margarita]